MQQDPRPWLDRQLDYADARREFEVERFVQEMTAALAVAIEDSGLTQAEVAARLGKSGAFISQVLSGRRNCTMKTLAEVAWAANARLSVNWAVLQPELSSAGGVYQSSVLHIRKFTYQQDQLGLSVNAGSLRTPAGADDGVAA